MKKTINQTYIEGYLYDHKLAQKVSGPNTKNPNVTFINGTIDIATDEELLNIVSVHFTYVTPTTSKGSTNATYTVLENILNGVYPTCMKSGKENAVKLSVNSALGLNEFFTEKEGKETLVSAKRNEGGFVSVAMNLKDDENDRAFFKTDMLITKVAVVEGDPEKDTVDKAVVSGFVFDFRNSLLPVDFETIHPGAISYFESLEASPMTPTFTCVWGHQISQTIKKTITEESAFGEPHVREVKSSRKAFLITGASPEPYVWDDASSMTAVELKEALAKRELDIAATKQRNDEYKASKANNTAASAFATAKASVSPNSAANKFDF